ncbi:MAG: 23S rRNA (guanosine(2251)-2'-O)-methyltransferase RlmB [Candidatus Eisenbacteria bacterium]
MAKNYMLLYGKNSVLERLRADPESIKKVLLSDKFHETEIEDLIEKHAVPAERLTASDLAKKRPAKDLQGIVAKVSKFKYAEFDDLLGVPESQRRTLVFLDRVNDPHNLGVILRTSACFGGFALIIPEFEACDVNETVLHVASGAENYTPVSMVTNISHSLAIAKQAGYWIVGAVVDEDAISLEKGDLPFPLGLVLGSEGSGIRHGLKKHLDMKVRIPMEGALLSFNVNIACAIFCYEICRQRVREQ